MVGAKYTFFEALDPLGLYLGTWTFGGKTLRLLACPC